MSDSTGTPIRLEVEDLQVTTYATSESAVIGDGGYCCTGCVSGCGINPTAGYCESGGASSIDYCM